MRRRRPYIWSTVFAYRRMGRGLAPVIPIKVLAHHRWKKVWAYVDSGAVYSILTVAEARRLGLLRIKARKIVVATSGGVPRKISLHRLWIKIGDDHRLSVTFGVPRGFNVDVNLLGRRDAFRRYRIFFDDSKAILAFTRQIE